MKLLLVAFVIILQNVGFAQTEKGLVNKIEVNAKCQQIIDDLTNSEFNSAFDSLRMIWVMPEVEFDYLEKKSLEMLNIVMEKYGASIGNVLAKESLVDNVLYRVTYVVKYERHGLRFKFTFYNGKDDKWYLNNFKWDDNLSNIFDD